MHINILRDYMELEYSGVKDKLKVPYSLERIIDDWILLAYFVGNDFLPHLPCLDIAQGAIQVLGCLWGLCNFAVVARCLREVAADLGHVHDV